MSILKTQVELELWKYTLKMQEPSIYNLLEIEDIQTDENIDNKSERIMAVLWLDKKHTEYCSDIYRCLMSGLYPPWKTKQEKDYILWGLWMIAHHNFMWIEEFIQKYSISQISELWKVYEYYINIQNGKPEKNKRLALDLEVDEEKTDDFIDKYMSKFHKK